MTHREVVPELWRLRLLFARQWGGDASFTKALTRLYRTHCRELPPCMAEAKRDALLGRGVPAFASTDLLDVGELTWSYEREGDPAAAAWAERYLASVHRLAERYGLTRWAPGVLASDDPEGGAARSWSYGESLVHAWCAHRARCPIPPGQFAITIDATAYFVPPRTRPLEVEWDPRDETYPAARRRLHACVDRVLAEIRDAWERSPEGFVFRRSRQAERDVRWLFLRIRYRRTIREIVAAEGLAQADHVSDGDAPAVKRATERMARRLGVQPW